jgi:hypothetical protein
MNCVSETILALFAVCGASVRIIHLAACNNVGNSEQMFVKFYIGEF